jgi:hypothetical protein
LATGRAKNADQTVRFKLVFATFKNHI